MKENTRKKKLLYRLEVSARSVRYLKCESIENIDAECFLADFCHVEHNCEVVFNSFFGQIPNLMVRVPFSLSASTTISSGASGSASAAPVTYQWLMKQALVQDANESMGSSSVVSGF